MAHLKNMKLLVSALLISPSLAAYVLKKHYAPQNFTAGFNFRTVGTTVAVQKNSAFSDTINFV